MQKYMISNFCMKKNEQNSWISYFLMNFWSCQSLSKLRRKLHKQVTLTFRVICLGNHEKVTQMGNVPDCIEGLVVVHVPCVQHVPSWRNKLQMHILSSIYILSICLVYCHINDIDTHYSIFLGCSTSEAKETSSGGH